MGSKRNKLLVSFGILSAFMLYWAYCLFSNKGWVSGLDQSDAGVSLLVIAYICTLLDMVLLFIKFDAKTLLGYVIATGIAVAFAMLNWSWFPSLAWYEYLGLWTLTAMQLGNIFNLFWLTQPDPETDLAPA